MNAQRTTRPAQLPRGGFTLTELLVVIMVIGILSSTMLFAMYGAVQQAKVSRAQTQVVKLHELLMTRWDSYRTRPMRLLQVSAPGTPAAPVPVVVAARRDAVAIATARVNMLRDLMRMEMPDRITDVTDAPVTITLSYNYLNPYGSPMTGNAQITIAKPALSRQYYRRAVASAGNIANWTTTHQGAECLYLIIASIRDITGTGLDVLHEGEIGDVDGDGMLEILDPWGNPIEFLRWAPGYMASPGLDGQWGVAGTDDDGNGTTDDFWEAWDRTSIPGQWIPGGYGDDRAMITPMELAPDPNDATKAQWADQFNPLRIDASKLNPGIGDYPRNFALYPLIFSAGPDGKYEINVLGNLNYSGLTPPNHPYYVPEPPATNPWLPAGTPMDTDNDGELGFIDNITNHGIETR